MSSSHHTTALPLLTIPNSGLMDRDEWKNLGLSNLAGDTQTQPTPTKDKDKPNNS